MVHLKRWYLYLPLLLALACGDKKKDAGFTVEKIPDPMKHGGYVSNPDHLISEETEAELNVQMRQLDQSGRAQVAIVLLQTIGDKVPKDVAHDLFRLWHPGQKEKDNGLVVLLVNDQHRIEFETGYGLEGDLPDVICFRIQQSEMLPSFKANDIDQGMLKGMIAVVNVLQPPDSTQTATAGNATPSDSGAAFVDSLQKAMSVENMYGPSVLEDPYAVSQPEDAAADVDYGEQESAMGIGSLILLIVYVLFATIFVVRAPVAKKQKDLPVLFTINKWHRIWVYGLPILLGGLLINIPGDVYRGWMLLIVMYFTLLAYLTYRAIRINKNAAVALAGVDRHVQYETLNVAHANSWLSAILFPLPLLAYKRWHITRMNKLRYDPYDCDTCHQPMQLLKKGKKREVLNAVQAAEDNVGSIIYDVWACKDGHDHLVLGYRNLRTDATHCPSCNALTFIAGRRRTVRAATTSREGSGIQTYVCKHCHHSKDEIFVIPKLSTSSSSSSSGSSSSSSSSGSWGGGSSGGGGAGSSW